MSSSDIRPFRDKRMADKIESHVSDISKFQPMPNMVLVKVAKKNTLTNSGIIVPQRADNAAERAERVVEVVRVPKFLYFNPKDRAGSLTVDTSLEVKEGDMVIINHLEALNSWLFEFNSETHYLIKYDSIVVVLGDEPKPVNGYVLLEETVDRKVALLFEKEVVSDRFAIVKYIGKPNKDYIRNYDGRGNKLQNAKLWHDEGYEEMKPGDKIAFQSKRMPGADPIWKLEYKQYAVLGEYLVCQRPRIAAILKEG